MNHKELIGGHEGNEVKKGCLVECVELTLESGEIGLHVMICRRLLDSRHVPEDRSMIGCPNF